MLRRPPTVLQLTPEDLDSYTKRRNERMNAMRIQMNRQQHLMSSPSRAFSAGTEDADMAEYDEDEDEDEEREIEARVQSDEGDTEPEPSPSEGEFEAIQHEDVIRHVRRENRDGHQMRRVMQLEDDDDDDEEEEEEEEGEEEVAEDDESEPEDSFARRPTARPHHRLQVDMRGAPGRAASSSTITSRPPPPFFRIPGRPPPPHSRLPSNPMSRLVVEDLDGDEDSDASMPDLQTPSGPEIAARAVAAVARRDKRRAVSGLGTDGTGEASTASSAMGPPSRLQMGRGVDRTGGARPGAAAAGPSHESSSSSSAAATRSRHERIMGPAGGAGGGTYGRSASGTGPGASNSRGPVR